MRNAPKDLLVGHVLVEDKRVGADLTEFGKNFGTRFDNAILKKVPAQRLGAAQKQLAQGNGFGNGFKSSVKVRYLTGEFRPDIETFETFIGEKSLERARVGLAHILVFRAARLKEQRGQTGNGSRHAARRDTDTNGRGHVGDGPGGLDCQIRDPITRLHTRLWN